MTDLPISYSGSPPLQDCFEDEIERAAQSETANKAEAFEGLATEDFMPGSCPGSRAALLTKNSIVRNEKDPWDHSRYHLELLLDLSYPRTRLVQEFEKILDEILQPDEGKKFENSNRGRNRGRSLRLRNFAAFRLHNKYGTMPKARKIAAKNCDLDMMSDKAWRGMINNGNNEMKKFRAFWAV